MLHSDITGRILSCAVAVHIELGPGLPERSYHAAMRLAMETEGLRFVDEPKLPVTFRGVSLGTHCPDFIVEDKVVVEIKAVKQIEPRIEAQILKYLRISRLQVGLLLNFNCPSMNHGISRFVLNAPD